MTYGEVRDRALKLVNQYSLAGAQIAESYNNQADYVMRVPELVDDAQMVIASGPRPIRESKVLERSQAKEYGEMLEYRLPGDLMQIAPGGLLVLDGERFYYESGYAQPDDKRILLPRSITGTIRLEYYRRPRQITPDQEDADELDNSPLTHNAIPYYVAAHLVLQDDAFAYSALYNEWQNQLNGMYQRPQPHRGRVQNAYGDFYNV